MLCALTAAVMLGVVAPPVGATPAGPETKGKSTTVSTEIRDADGNPLADATVQVGALPVAGRSGSLLFETIGQGVTDANGVVTLRLRMADTARFMDSSGEAELRIWAQDADGDQSASHSMVVNVRDGWKTSRDSLPSSGNTASLAVASVEEEEVPLEEVPSEEMSLELVDGVSDAIDDTVVETIDGVPVAEADGNTIESSGLPFRACRFPDEVESLVGTSYYARKYLPVNRAITKSKSKYAYAYDTSSNTKWTVSANGAYGGRTKSVQNSTSMGVNFSVGTNLNQQLEVEWQYRQYDVRCYNSMIGKWTADTGKDDWRPFRHSGGNQKVNASGGNFTCHSSRIVTISSPTWMAKSSTAVQSNGATLKGVSLSQEQTASSSHKVTMTPTGSSARICGDTDLPPYAKKVREYS